LPKLLRALRVVLFLGLALGSLLAAAAEFRFRLPEGPPPVALSAAVLSDEERAWLAGLPEIRVALQRVGAPPYERVGADGEITGLQADILVTMARTFGLRLVPQVHADWPGVLRAVREREADMVLTLSVTPERLQYLAFTLGTVSVPAAVMGRSGEQPVPPEAARIALEREYYSNELVRRRYPAATVLPVDSTLEALRAVAERRADLYIGSLLEALDLLAREPVPGIEVQQILADGVGHYHFGVRKDWAPLVRILNKGITSYRATPGAAPDFAAIAASLPAGATLPSTLPSALALKPAEAQALAERSVWRVGAVRGLALLNEVDARGNHAGIAADYTEQVVRRLGVAAEVVPFDSVAAMLDALRAGAIDVVPFLTRTAARAREFGYSAPYIEMPYVLVGRSDGPLYWDLGSLDGRRLALAPAHPLRELLAERHPGIRVLDPRDGHEAMDMVALGDADAAVEVKLFANLRINADTAGRLRALGEVGDLPAQFHFATSREAAALVPLIDRALADIPPAERERMLRRWVAIDLQPPFPWRRWLPTLLVGGLGLAVLVGATLWWNRRLAQEVRQRRRADERLDDIGRTLPGVAFRYTLGSDGRIVHSFLSSGAQAFLGVTPRPASTLLDLLAPGLAPQDLQAARQAQLRACETGERFVHETAYRRPDGRELWLHAEALRSTTPEGQTAWTGYVIDASDAHALQQRLAREAQSRHLMLASASHELRAPTHTLALALQAVGDAGVPPPAARPLAVAHEAARTLAQLLDDVLDAARLDAGRLELRPREYDLHALLDTLADAYRGEAAAKGLAFAFERAADLPATVHGDPLRLKQVLVNLLSNAVKYTAAGQVRLHAGAAPGDEGVPALHFEVADTGAGIPAELQPRLFEPFATVDAAGGQRSTGLGLSICRRLVTLMGGRIELASAPGQGTRIGITLPLQTPAAVCDAVPLRRHGVLLVCDDDEVSRMLVAQMLRRAGHEVVEADHATQALACCRQGGVRLLISDLRLPDHDGLWLARELRAVEAGAPERTGIVICSGSTPPPAAAAAPCDAWLTKPVEPRTLADTVAALLRAPLVAAPGAAADGDTAAPPLQRNAG
jgi:two-component system sensor histidine kinase EvgS